VGRIVVIYDFIKDMQGNLVDPQLAKEAKAIRCFSFATMTLKDMRQTFVSPSHTPLRRKIRHRQNDASRF
jgi:hypothetical protein